MCRWGVAKWILRSYGLPELTTLLQSCLGMLRPGGVLLFQPARHLTEEPRGRGEPIPSSAASSASSVTGVRARSPASWSRLLLEDVGFRRVDRLRADGCELWLCFVS